MTDSCYRVGCETPPVYRATWGPTGSKQRHPHVEDFCAPHLADLVVEFPTATYERRAA